jgi:hypothetical protein
MDIIKQKLHITQLLLDSENPRHDVIENQAEIIRELLANEKIENLAKDIAEQGSLSPLDTIGVLRLENEDYIVIEGNRRVCACMLLNNPDLSPDDSTRKKITNIKNSGFVPVELECVIFEDRESADHWIKLRHEGPQGGIGTKEWNSEQKTRYIEKIGGRSPNKQALKLLDYAVEKGIIQNGKKSDFKITTLTRYLSNPIVRNAFGLQNGEDLNSKHDELSFKNLVTQFFDDYKKGKVTSRSNKDKRVEYANELQNIVIGPPPPDNPIIDYGKQSGQKTEAKQKENRSKRDPAKRLYLPSSIFSINDKILNRVYLELKKIPVEPHELAVAYLFRAFIERLAVLYLKRHQPGKLGTDSKLHTKLKWVSEDLKNTHGISTKKLKVVNHAASAEYSKIGPSIFGMMVHLIHIPSKRELNQMWDTWDETLHMIHSYIE